MSDRIFYSLAALTAFLMIALAAVYPQGVGAKSPKPFGHAIIHDQPVKAAKPAEAAPLPLRGSF